MVSALDCSKTNTTDNSELQTMGNAIWWMKTDNGKWQIIGHFICFGHTLGLCSTGPCLANILGMSPHCFTFSTLAVYCVSSANSLAYYVYHRPLINQSEYSIWTYKHIGWTDYIYKLCEKKYTFLITDSIVISPIMVAMQHWGTCHSLKQWDPFSSLQTNRNDRPGVIADNGELHIMGLTDNRVDRQLEIIYIWEWKTMGEWMGMESINNGEYIGEYQIMRDLGKWQTMEKLSIILPYPFHLDKMKHTIHRMQTSPHISPKYEMKHTLG